MLRESSVQQINDEFEIQPCSHQNQLNVSKSVEVKTWVGRAALGALMGKMWLPGALTQKYLWRQQTDNLQANCGLQSIFLYAQGASLKIEVK